MAYSGQAVFGGTTDPVTGSWTNATALNSAVTSSDITGYGVVAASFVITGTVTQGTAIFEVSDDGGTTWWPVSGLQTGSNNQASSFALTGSSGSFEFATGAYNLFRARLNPVILGSGSVAVRLSAEAFPFLTAVAITGTTNVSITGTNAVTVASTVQIQGDNPSGQSNIGNPVKIGAAFNTTQPTVTNGQIIDAQATARGAIIVATGVDAFNSAIFAGSTALTATGTSLNVNITGGSSSGTQYANGTAVATPTGTVALGWDGANVRAILTSATGQQHVITDPGSTTAVTGTVAVTQSTSPWVVSLTSTTITGTVAVTQSGAWTVAATQSGTWTVQQGTPPWTIQGDSASGTANAGNPVKTSAVFNTTQPTVTNGQTVDNQATARGGLIVATGVDTFNVSINTALPAGTNVIGHVITDSGSTTVVTGTVAVTQSTSPWVVSLTSTTITGTVAVTQSTSPWVSNVTQWASTALGVPQTFGTAPTGVVIGTSSDLYVAGTRARSNQTTTAAGVQDVNIVGSLGVTNSVTNGTFIAVTDNTTKVGVIAATTALKTDMSSVAGTATVTAAAGVQKVGIVGGAGTSLETTVGVLDYNLRNVGNSAVVTGTGASGAGIQRVTVSNDSKVVAWDGTNTTVVKPASTAALAADPALVVTMSPNTISVPVTQAPAFTSSTSVATWNSSTALNTTATVFNAVSTYDALLITLNQTTTITAGQITFEVSNDGSNWLSITGVSASQFGTFAELGVYFLTPSTYVAGFFNTTDWQYFRVRLSTAITGTGSVTIGFAAQAGGAPPIVARQPHNFGRTFVSITLDQIAAPTTEALVTMTVNKGGTVTTGTSYTVTNGKSMRLQSVDAVVSSSSGTQPVKVRIRSAATVAASSPILWTTYFSATTSSLGIVNQVWPDGLEIASAQQVGVSMVSTGSTSNGVSITLVGYEY